MNNIDLYKRDFTQKALNNGFSSDNIQKCLDYATPILQKGLPVIYNITHFSQLVGYNQNYLKRAIKFTPYFYRSFTINKKNKTKRVLYEPLPSLKEIQDWILKEILNKCKVSRYAKAYVSKRSVKEHTIYHTDEDIVMTFDIKTFFNTIKFRDVENLFLQLGYSDRISNLITKLCFRDNELPQGAPTSPYISNLILLSFDQAIGAYCMENKVKYSRYADDLAFSGKLDKVDKQGVTDIVRKELTSLGFELNDRKTKTMLRNDPQIISGIIVNKKPQVPKRERNKLRQEMHYIKTFDLANHMLRTKQNKQNYLKHLLGRINYILQINPRDKEFKEYYQYLINESKIKG